MQLWTTGQEEMPDDLLEGPLTLRKLHKTEKLLFYYLQTLFLKMPFVELVQPTCDQEGNKSNMLKLTEEKGTNLDF